MNANEAETCSIRVHLLPIRRVAPVDRHIGFGAWSSSFSLLVASIKQAKA
jgi:hypothetical protein